MSRDRLVRAIDAVDTAREATTDGEIGERLAQLVSHLESQADRDSTPALGTLDRVQTKLRDIEDETSDPTVEDALADARQHILSFLGTLDDRGMKQH
ncbi:DUF7553 family protein [Halobacterium hubeiense]|uniref:DUF7553 family protein n=1 Tax=Halobacterium hubeiense TaxID=1407499 RepID=UPI003C724E6D